MVGDKQNKTKQVSMKLIATLAPAQAEIEAGLWLRLTNNKSMINQLFNLFYC
jgi:hypothetical protein